MPIQLLGMVRTLHSILLVLLLCATLVAQQRQVRVELESGTVLVGEFKDADEVSVLLIMPEGELRIRRADIVKIDEIVPVPPGKAEPEKRPVAGSEPEVGQPGWNLKKTPGPSEPEESKQATPAVPGSAKSAAVPPGQPSIQASPTIPADRADARVGRLLDRYQWIVPRSNGNKISLGAVIFLVLMLFIQFSSRMANLEARSLTRSGLFAILLFVILAIELGVTPFDPTVILAVAIADVVFWYVLVSLVFSAGAYGATVMLVSFTLSSLVGVVCLEVMGFVMQEGALP